MPYWSVLKQERERLAYRSVIQLKNHIRNGRWKMMTHQNLQTCPSFAATIILNVVSFRICTAFGINARGKRWERGDSLQYELAATSQPPWRVWPKLMQMALGRRNSLLIWGTYFNRLNWCSTILQYLRSFIFQNVIKPTVRVKPLDWFHPIQPSHRSNWWTAPTKGTAWW